MNTDGSTAGSEAAPGPVGSKRLPLFHKIENTLAFVLLILVAVLPLLEALLRSLFHSGIPYISGYVQHLVLWISFVGGMITSRERRHLALSAGVDRMQGPVKLWVLAVSGGLCVALSVALCFASLSFAVIGFDPTQKVGFLPISALALVMPLGFGVIAVRFITGLQKGAKRWLGAGLGILLGLLLGWSPLLSFIYAVFDLASSAMGMSADAAFAVLDAIDSANYGFVDFINPFVRPLSLLMLILLTASAMLGTPIFIVLGGAALLFFLRSGGSLEIMPNEAYTMLTGTVIPAIPLFTLAGFFLSESKAGERLVRLFRTLFGWLPGGLAVMSILVCAFFTTFTGGSGVTILALGGLLSFVLIKMGYPRKFSTGLLTGSGSIGLLFPPSLPIIMYGVVAQVNIKELFVGGLLPGLVMIVVLAGMGIRSAIVNKVERVKFELRDVLPTLKESVWEILLPVVVLVSYFSGFTTLVETAALAVVYVLLVQVILRRDIKLKALPGIFAKCVPIMGGILIILAVAKGLSYYIVDAEVPTILTEWSQAHIHSKYVFLMLLNLALLLTGCLMDIFSAITVVAPLVIPLGVAYGIHPVHLGIIFLANLELGYLTPPVGLNLFLASYRFEEPLAKMYRNVIPFLIALLAAVLLITYLPFLTTGLLQVIEL